METLLPQRPTAPAFPRHQSGLGLVQTMLILLLVASALAAGALLLQARRAPDQAATQEQTLRWADEAVAAFAASNARLPCPAATLGGDEDCSGGNAKGWLPLRTLLGASGTGPDAGPVAYMVYRGGASEHLDLTRPGNAYRPTLIDGSTRPIVTRDGDGNEASREFASINGLDLCRALELAELAGTDTSRAHVPTHNGATANVAYGVAVAGPHAGASRFDEPDAGQWMAAPSRKWDSGYDDRVRVRTFAGVGQALGCRTLASDGPAPATIAAMAGIPFLDPAATDPDPYNVSLAAMDALSAAVTLHDALKALQDQNVEATSSAVLGASIAQVGSVVKLVLAAAKVSDSVTTLTNNAASLARAVGTCIASLGIMCWEVPLKVTAVALSVGSVANSAAALGLNIGAIPPTAMALARTVEARDRAKQAARERPRDLKATLDDMACKLYGNDPPEPPDGSRTPYNPCSAENDVVLDADNNPVLKTDEYGAPIPVRDGMGRQMFDSNGDPLYEYEYSVDDDPQGLDEKRDEAHADWQFLQRQVDLLEQLRLSHWSDYRIRHDRIDRNLTLGRRDGRYRVTRCVPAADGKGDYRPEDGACVAVARIEDEQQGTHDRVEELDLDLATADAIRLRELAEQWAAANLQEGEIEHEVTELQKNYDMWFVGRDGLKALFASMTDEKNDANHCGATPVTELSRQKCQNATESLHYVATCERQAVDPVTGNVTRQQDRDPNASCRPRMDERLAAARERQRTISSTKGAIEQAYRNQPGPYLRYPEEWFIHALEEVEGGDGRTHYVWRRSDRRDEYWLGSTGDLLPYYAPEPWNDSGSPPLLVWSSLEIVDRGRCEFILSRLWWAPDARKHGLYCQRYPYSRAYSDWILASKAADEAKVILDALVEQFENLEHEYRQLRETGQPEAGNVATSPVGFGAESALERADARGSVGPQPVGATP